MDFYTKEKLFILEKLNIKLINKDDIKAFCIKNNIYFFHVMIAIQDLYYTLKYALNKDPILSIGVNEKKRKLVYYIKKELGNEELQNNAIQKEINKYIAFENDKNSIKHNYSIKMIKHIILD